MDAPADIDAAKAYTQAVRYLATMEPGRGVTVQISNAAHGLIREAVENIVGLNVPGAPSGLKGHLEKWGKFLPRLVLIFHCVDLLERNGMVDPAEEIDCDTVAKTIRFARFLLRHSLTSYDTYAAPAEQTSEARWIAGHLLTKPDLPQLSRRDIYQANTDLKTKANLPRLLSAMRELENVGWCKATKFGPDGTTHWRINPKIHTRFKSHAERETRQRKLAQQRLREEGQIRSNWVKG